MDSPRYRHKKTGRIYAVICTAARETDQEAMTVYYDVESCKIWVRPASEFHARFEAVA